MPQNKNRRQTTAQKRKLMTEIRDLMAAELDARRYPPPSEPSETAPATHAAADQ